MGNGDIIILSQVTPPPNIVFNKVYNILIRGFETVSYLLEGEFTHEDFLGHRGVLKVDKMKDNNGSNA